MNNGISPSRNLNRPRTDGVNGLWEDSKPLTTEARSTFRVETRTSP
ncbi:MAG: hypothetical protein ACKPEN_12210 [Planktothrix sp.]